MMALWYYQCDATHLPAKKQGLTIVQAGDAEYLFASPRKLPGFKKASAEAFNAAQRAAAGTRSTRPHAKSRSKASAARTSFVRELPLLLEHWQVEPESTRSAELARVTVGNRRAALRCLLGGGRGDLIVLGCSLPVSTEPIVRIGVTAEVLSPDKDQVQLRAILTSARRRPWLESQEQTLDLSALRELTFDLTELDSEKRAKCDVLLLSIRTDLDEGFALIHRVYAAG